MRDNGPVTNREIEMGEDDVLVSKTDTGGRITFGNEAFVKISGYARDELMGAPHNMVRHRDMPKEAFANLWATIKAGRPWEGLVKNRAKNGDHYWVRANATPIIENGQTTGYISIRSKPTKEETVRADRIYADIREGRAKGIGLDDGEVVETGVAASLKRFARSIRGQLIGAFAVVMVLMAMLGADGVSGLRAVNDSLREVYAGRVVPLQQLKQVSDDYAVFVVDASHKVRNGNFTWEQGLESVQSATKRIHETWDVYLAASLSPEEKRLAEQAKALMVPADAAVDELTGILKARNAAALDAFVKTKLYQIIDPLTEKVGELVNLQLSLAKTTTEDALSHFDVHIIETVVTIAVTIAVVIALNWWLAVCIRRPIERLEGHFNEIGAGNHKHRIETPAVSEFRRVSAQLRGLQARIRYSILEKADLDEQANLARVAALNAMADTVEREAGRAVEQVAARTGQMAHNAEDMAHAASDVTVNSQSVAAASEQALANAQTVAAATEELAASIREISAQIAQSTSVIRKAVECGDTAQTTIRSLSDAVGRIGEVVTLIQEIAGQTNLLALNATIEAARAGEAGKGFAVVAGEVKNLASQTARSTEEITRQISDIQAATGQAVAAVAQIGETISDIDHISSSIAAAMEEQAAATQEISRNVVETTTASKEVSARIADVSLIADQTGAKAQEVREEVTRVNVAVEELRRVLVRVVRTSSTDADRRAAPRYQLREAAEIEIGSRRIAVVVENMSLGGAKLTNLNGSLPTGGRGTLVMSNRNLRAPFETLTGGDSEANIKLDQMVVETSDFRRAFDAMVQGRAIADKAA
ncbi:MAG TPA: methyl-accepting chemotaxis protein [Azospirillaceae bacterium]|nr:methyl-accepting chemotaxis protein [Azospirillaceae bacterium]